MFLATTLTNPSPTREDGDLNLFLFTHYIEVRAGYTSWALPMVV